MVLLDALRSHPLGVKLGKLIPAQAWEKRPSLFFGLAAFTLVSSLLLGGGTRGGFLSDAILELLAIPAFLMSLSMLFAAQRTERNRPPQFALLLCFATALLPLLQLVPLPPFIWQWLPQREEILTVFELAGAGLPWLPISVAPNATWLSALSLLPPLAVFLGVLQMSYRERRHLSLILLGVGIVGAMVGLLQVAQGPSSPLRFFAFTNEYEAVGFFANRNHFAALLYMLVLYGAAWATDLAFTAGSWRDLRSLDTSIIAALTASLLAVVILIAAETVSRSRAGLGLMIVAMFGAFALPSMDLRKKAGVTPVKLMIVATIVAVLLVVQFALYRILDRFATDPLQDARIIFAHNTMTAALAYLPFGSGFGTFGSVYPMFEAAKDTLANIYANHAHDDVLEVCLEGGATALALIALFVTWLVLRAKAIWRRPPTHVRPIDVLLARAATLAIGLLIAHSFVDYPLRTDAMMVVLAFSCALLIEPFRGTEDTVAAAMRFESVSSGRNESLLESPPVFSPASAASPDLPQASGPAARPPAGERWGENIAWPEEWSKSKPQKSGVKEGDG
jgi:O-antigen ligase